MGGWKDEARRTMVGPRQILTTIGGELWVAPKKLPSSAFDALDELKRAVFRDPTNRERARRYREIKRANEDGGDVKTDVLEMLDLYPQMPSEHRDAIYRIALRYGIGGHNFVDDGMMLIGGGIAFDIATIEEIVSFGPMAAEIHGIVEAWNRPLAPKSGTRSETSQSGSAAESIS
jgi:hypothetical protein